MDDQLRPEDINAVREELIIQKVMLDSMQGEDFDGDEGEKEDIRKEIVRLKDILRRESMKQKATASQGSSQTMTATSQSNAEPDSPSHRSPTMAPSSRQGADIWSPNSAKSLPSRKRDANALDPFAEDEPNKSRRSTPTPRRPTTSSSDPFDTEGLTVIDLTGDDIDLDALFVADQIKQERLQQQENADRKLAEALSRQADATSGQGSSGSTTNGAPSNMDEAAASSNALTRLMQTQQANSPAPGSSMNSSSDVLQVEYPAGPPPGSSVRHPLPIPGSYDARWDAPAASYIPSMSQSSRQQPIQPGRSPHSHPRSANRWQGPPLSGSGSSAFPINLSGPSFPPNGGGSPTPLSSSVGPAHQRPGMGAFTSLPGSGMISNGLRRGMDGLSDIINRTSMFANPDFNADPRNHPFMPERLSNFLESAIHDPRVTEKELDDLLQNIRPDMDIPESMRGNTPTGLKNNLYHHQEIALTWMKKMEAGTNKGGILADDMGLGKTISTLALMLENRAKSRPKTNLIIGPLSLIRQWEEEIRTKTTHNQRLSVFIHHGTKTTTDDLLKYDVVLTTYGTIAAELRRLEKFKVDNADRSIDYNDRSVALKFPLLHPSKAKFYRVILDEAQCIKNKRTQTSLACHALKATYRWCLTGTPMMNGVVELYPYLRFLKIKPYNDSAKFTEGFGILFGKKGDPKHVAMNRLRALLKAIMLRRKKDSKLDGKPILLLPPKKEEVVYAELSTDERDFYNQLEKKSQVQFSKYLREGSVGKNYSSILVLLLRLRQACCHPHLNLDVNDTNPMSEEDMIETVKQLDLSIVARIKAVEAFECPICYDAVTSPCFFVPCGHDSCSQCLSQLADNAASMNIQEGNESDKARCPVCRTDFDPRRCFTYEAFQKVFMPEAVNKDEQEASGDEGEEEEEEDDDDSDDDEDEDNTAGDDIDAKGNLKDFIVDDEFEDSDASDSKQVVRKGEVIDGQLKQKKKKKKKSRGKRREKKIEVKPSMLKQLRKDASKNRKAYKLYMQYLRKTWMPAAKVSECMRLLKEIEQTGEKTIVFSQWTLLLDLLEIAMEHEEFGHKPKRYDGSMSGELRSVAAKEFRDRKDVKVMLVSLRAGNAGLNLTSATRVIIMDPFWNPYIEMQAVDRAYRIGQQNEVKVYRILTKDTVEDRIVDLKEKKQEMVESALDESESAKIGRLNVNELRFLFNASSPANNR